MGRPAAVGLPAGPQAAPSRTDTVTVVPGRPRSAGPSPGPPAAARRRDGPTVAAGPSRRPGRLPVPSEPTVAAAVDPSESLRLRASQYAADSHWHRDRLGVRITLPGTVTAASPGRSRRLLGTVGRAGPG
jgi:hypothetical protein